VSIEIKVPQLPESVSDAVVAGWHKKAGESIRREEVLVELETEKVVLEVPAPESGVVDKILQAEGATVTAGEVLAVLTPGEAAADAGSDGAAGENGGGESEDDGADGENGAPESENDGAGAKDDGADSADAAALSPAVRRLLSGHNINPAAIPGSGKGGRILKGDVLRYFQEQAAPEEKKTPPPASPSSPPAAASRNERRETMSRIRRTIARRLLESQQSAAILTTFNEVNMRAVLELRARHKESFEKRHGARLGFMSFFVKACAAGLQKFPVVNAAVDGDDIIYHNYCDIGIAVSSPRGLVVPVLRNAEGMDFAAVEKQIADYGKQAADGSLSLDALTGGTFTITNGGVFGSLLSTPIINPPQSAILGMHAIQPRPVAEDGQVVIRPMMYVALSYDHRIIDGREAVGFLVAVKEKLEDPARMLLQL